MSQKANNDIDILLRKLSRQDRDAVKAVQDGQHTEHAHLDADELNAYAENALPSALRARYTDHLSECTSCRKIVTQLSLASAVVVPGRVEAKPSALKTFLAGLFSPSIFRYAVPAMAILAVVTIAWFAVQRQRMASSPKEVAQNVSSGSNAPPSQAEFNTSDSPVNAQPNLVSNAKESRSRPGEKAADVRPESQDREQLGAEEKKLAATAADDLRNRQDMKRDQPQPSAAAPAAAGATVMVQESPKPGATAERSEGAQKKESEADKNKVMNEPQDRVSTQSAPPPKSPATRVPANKRAMSVGETTSSVRRENTAKDESERTEVRTVGGHRFHKKGEVWVDSQYSSQPITNVSRGSEQYRALVADEPGIRSIAEQLKTEFIVVWNGRAYRVR